MGGRMPFPGPHVSIVPTGALSAVDCVTMKLESLGYENVKTRQTEDGFRVAGTRLDGSLTPRPSCEASKMHA